MILKSLNDILSSRYRVLFAIGTLLILLGIFYLFLFDTGKEPIHRSPKPLLMRAIRMSHSSINIVRPHAIDFGAGRGDETLFLLKNGFYVTAIEKERKGLYALYSQLEGKPYFKYLKTVQSKLNQINWASIEKSDFFLASDVLPFCSPNEFKTVWLSITDHIKPGGLFVGQFYEEPYQRNSWWAPRKIISFSEKEILGLFKEFEIKHLTRKKEHYYHDSGEAASSAYYEVIAQKKQSEEG